MELFLEKPFYCFTMDTDWASEEQIDFTLDLFDEYGVVMTPFITHPSETIARRFSDKRDIVGLHPNFLPESSHGDSYEKVVDHVRRLWPESVFYRSHSFFDNTHIGRLFSEFGFKFDSNLLLYLQNHLFPLKHNSGLLRFPVAWEDDVHLWKRLPPHITTITDFLASPGLKIFNFHPIHVYLNTPSLAYYFATKEKSMKRSFEGSGVKTMLIELLEWLENEGVRCYTLPELYKVSTDHNSKACFHPNCSRR
jgi:hypothetical protein